MENNQNTKDSIENKKFAYNILMQGYHSRDETMPRTFYQMIQTFSVFNFLLFGSQYITIINSKSDSYYITLAIYLLIVVAGFVSLFAFLLDMEGVSSGKNALRGTCTDLEKELKDDLGEDEYPKYWDSIANRDKYLLERMMKSYTKSGVRELRTGGFGYLKAAKIIVLLWGIAVIIYGFILFGIKISVAF